MTLQFYYPRWGSENSNWDDFCLMVKQAGYHGIEAPVPEDLNAQNDMLKALKKNKLKLIGQYYQSFEKDFETHKTNYIKQLYLIASVKPEKINAQTGKDYFSYNQNAELFIIANKISKETGVVICHETHRNKALFAAHVALNFFKKIPTLKITADFSHWCVVSESLLEDQEVAMSTACKHVEHIHSRVGHSQSAQVIDPRLPEFENALNAHISWWDTIAKRYKKSKKTLTITTEFGPTPYMVNVPFTQVPIANQWDINIYMMQLFRNRYL